LARQPEGIFVAPFEQGEIGPDLFRKALRVQAGGPGIEASRPTVSPGRSPSWVKVENRSHPAMYRVKDTFA
jgi:bifunctional non-homologous end joining protein LigD